MAYDPRRETLEEYYETRLKSQEELMTRDFVRHVKCSTDIINGLLREIDALHFLLEQERKNRDQQSDEGDRHTYKGQYMRF